MLPPEVTSFLREPGRSLVVKGAAGAGKTLFGLAVAKWFQLELGDVVWVNSRDTEPAVVAELDEFVPPEQRIDLASALAQPEERDPSPMELLDDLREALAEGGRTLVVLDSVSALTDDAPARERVRFERGVVRLTRERGANIMLVVESEATSPIEYLADGIVALTEEETPLGRLRVLRSQKLRGAPAALARHPFTLTDGEYWTSELAAPEPPELPARAPARPDEKSRISTGTHSWDLLLGGGLPRGSVCLLETSSAVGPQHYAFVVPLALNTRALGRDLVTLLPAGESRRELERWVLAHLPPAPRGAWTAMEAGELLEAPRFGDAEASLDERLTRLERARAKAPAPVVSILSVDALASAGPRGELESWLARWTFQTRQKGHVDILVARPESSAQVLGVADSHWRLDVWEGHVLARGLAPVTEPLFVHFHASRGFPETELRRIQ